MSINAADEDVPILDGHRDSNDDDSRRRRSRRRNRTGGLKWWVGRNAGEESERSIAVDDEAVSDDDFFILDDDSCCGRVVQALGRVQWFWAELVLFLYMFCDFPATLVNQKYTLEWISVYNWNDDLARNVTHDFNITDGGGSVSTCTSNTSSDEYKFSQRSQMMSSYFGMLRMAVWVFPAILSTLVLGSVSDRHGRKWAFIPPILGCFLSMLGQMCIVHFRGSILWLLILDFATGISGSFGCVIMAGVAHVVGKTTARNRMLRITVLQLFLLAGSTVSPFTMGMAYNRLGATLTLAITAAVSGTNLAYCLLCVPAMRGAVNSGLVVDSDPYSSSKSYSVDEPASPPSSLPPTYTPPPPPPPPPEPANGLSNSGGPTDQPPGLFRQISQHVRNTCNIYSSSSSGSGGKRGSGRGRAPAPNDHVGLTSSLLASFSELVASQSSTGFSLESCKSSGEAVCRLRILICAFFVIITAYFDVLIMTLFELNYPLCWGPATIGLYTGVFVSVAAVGSMVLAPFMERFSSHVSVAIVCCLTSAAYRVYLFFVRDTNSMFYGVVLNVFNMMLIPSVRTMMTLLVEPGRHGAVLGSISAVEILCCFLGSVIFSTVYSNTLLYSTATVFLVSASLYGIGAIIFTGYRIRYGTGSVILSGSMPDVLV